MNKLILGEAKELEIDEEDMESLRQAKATLQNLYSQNPELPSEFIEVPAQHMNYKFRGNWFQGVVDSARLVADIYEDDELMEKANQLTEIRHKPRKDQRTTREEIDQGDQVILAALKKLENL
jgi:hypothetical protein